MGDFITCSGEPLDLDGDLEVFLLPKPLIGACLFGELGVPKLLLFLEENGDSLFLADLDGLDAVRDGLRDLLVGEVDVKLVLFENLYGDVAEVTSPNLCPTSFFGEDLTFDLAANLLLMTRLFPLTSKFLFLANS